MHPSADRAHGRSMEDLAIASPCNLRAGRSPRRYALQPIAASSSRLGAGTAFASQWVAMTPPKKVRPSARLVVHDIRVELTPQPTGGEKLCAYVECERRRCKLNVDECRSCERLVRIDSHEAGFVVLCRSKDETFDSDE